MNTGQPQTTLGRIKDAWASLSCRGRPLATEESMAPANLQPTGGVDVSVSQSRPTILWQCVRPYEHCARCPRRQAYWQGFRASEDRSRDLHMTVGAQQIKPKVGDGDGEVTQVNDFKCYSPGTIITLEKGEFYPYPHTVLNPVSPSVIQAQNSTKNRDSQCDGLKKCDIHLEAKHSSAAMKGGAA